MSNSKIFVAAKDRISQIGINQKRVNTLKDQTGEMTAESQALKLDSYAHLIAGIAPAKLTSKSNLNGKDRVSLKGDLENFGNQTPSMADKLIKNAVGARNVFGIGGDNWTPAAVLDVFKDNEITSEAKLVKAVSGDDKKSKVQMAVEKIAGRRSTKKNDKGERVAGDKWLGGFTYDEIEEFNTLLEDALRTRKEAEEKAAKAMDKTEEDNDDVNEMMNAL